MQTGIFRQPSWLKRRRADVDAFACALGLARRRAGLKSRHTLALRFGVPLLAIAVFFLTLLLAWLAPDAGGGPTFIGVALMLLASVPWLGWLVRGDPKGPTWSFVVAALLPIAALVTGHWFIASIGLGSAATIPLLAFPCLFAIILVVSVAPKSLALGTCGIAYLAFNGPLIAAWIADRDVATPTMTTWQVVFVLGFVVGYAVRMSFEASTAVNQAHGMLAQQSVEEERRRIARDVHDVVAHTLAVTMLHLTAARMAVRRMDAAGAEDALVVAEHHGRESMNDIRRMVRLLRSDTPDLAGNAQPGLPQIEAVVDRYRAAGLPVQLTLEGADRQCSPGTELAAFRIVQEALANAAKHGTGPASVVLRVDPAGITLRIANPAAIKAIGATRGSGISGMKERSIATGGSLRAGLRQGEWIVEAELPVGLVA